MLSWQGMSRQVVIFGRAGQLGAELIKVCADRQFAAIGLTRNDVDVTDAQKVEEIVSSLNPSLVLNATAYNMVDAAESDPAGAMAGNALAVRNLAIAASKAGARFVHVSTDYVFDGQTDRPWRESDRVGPLSTYGISKLAGEHMALAYSPEALVIRTCGVYGIAGLNTRRGNFIETMLRLGVRSEPVRVVADVIASPTYAVELAVRLLHLADLGQQGVFHAGGGEPVSWFDFARIIFEEAGLTPELVPSTRDAYPTPAKRPVYSALSNSRMEAAGVPPMPSVRECVRSYLRTRKIQLNSPQGEAQSNA
jgi:dTDP-4-dehydrorhamnose reductase